MPKKILIIEDNHDLAHLLESHLRDLSFQVDLSFDGMDGLTRADSGNYDLVILDLMLPGLDGVEICQRLRRKDSYVPILMLTAKSSEMDRVVGLEVGADDYVTKPFSIRELLARVKAIFRRVDELTHGAKKDLPSVIRTGDLVIDPVKRSAHIAGRSVDLTAKEFDLLLHFAHNPGKVYTRSQLLDIVWGYGHDGYEHTVNSHINRLRAKIEEDPANPSYVLTVWGVGYRFVDT
ncbi:MAG: response regulator transcription factor [Deltaproteobacteria bacterium]|jgi:DNA-binding response OmpR family regulator|nr:response regulator transcription factor [Deltaproteobacteria bacterium]MBW2469730.1 response regulator transcription factor [Deltaproteobacteria bacterium]